MAQKGGSPLSCITKADLLSNGLTPSIASLVVDARDHTPTEAECTVCCVTPDNKTTDDLLAGKFQDTLLLRENASSAKGSTINWTASANGYRSQDDAMYAARACYTAADAWNKVLEGRLQFVYVDSFDAACFQLTYGGVHPEGVLARAFTPDSHKKTLNEVVIYQGALEGKYRDQIVDTFAHELGHGLGLGQEQSQDKQTTAHGTSYCAAGQVEDGRGSGSGSILFGTRNPYSIIRGYYNAMKVQDADCDESRLSFRWAM